MLNGDNHWLSKSLKKLERADIVGEYLESKRLREGSVGNDYLFDKQLRARQPELSWDILTVWTIVLGCWGCFGFVTFITYPNVFVLVAFAFAILSGVSLVIVQRGIKREYTMRQLQNAMRGEVSQFQLENKILKQSVDQLNREVERLKPFERKLRGTLARNGENTDALVDLVAVNRKVIEEVQKFLRADIVQEIVSIILDSDTNGDFLISRDEVDILILRLGVVEGVKYIQKEKMREILLGKNCSLSAILEVVKNLLNDQVIPESEIILSLDLLKRKPPKTKLERPIALCVYSSDSDETLWE